MISVEKACELLMEHCKGYSYVSAIYELDDLYLIGLITEDGYIVSDGLHSVNKETGELGAFCFTRENAMNYKNNKKEIEIPEKYRYDGEIIYGWNKNE